MTMDITRLIASRKLALERLEAVKAQEHSDSPDERMAYQLASQNYLLAENDYQRAVGMLTTEEMQQMGIVA